jgi:hypothetical protein
MIKWLKSWSPKALCDYNIKVLEAKEVLTDAQKDDLDRMKSWAQRGSW